MKSTSLTEKTLNREIERTMQAGENIQAQKGVLHCKKDISI